MAVPLRLLWIWWNGWKCCKTTVLRFFLLWSWRQNTATFSQLARRRARIEVHWRLIGFLWPKISQMWRLLKPTMDGWVHWLWPYQRGLCRPCVDLEEHFLCSLIIFPSVLTPTGQFSHQEPIYRKFRLFNGPLKLLFSFQMRVPKVENYNKKLSGKEIKWNLPLCSLNFYFKIWLCVH